VTRVEHRLDPLLAALGRPDVWSISLAGFLVRGGVLLFLLPIAAIPSPLDVANVLGPAVTSAALGGPNPDLVRVVVVASLATVAAVAVAFALGAATDVATARIGAAELGASSPAPATGVVRRAFVVRLAALIPFAIVLAATVPAVVGATYHELILPDELVTPVVLRVIRDVPIVVIALLAAWLVGEAIGGLAVRLIVLEGRGVIGGIRGALALVAHRPRGAVGALAAGTLVLVVLVGPALAATALAWRWATSSLRAGPDPVAATVAVLALAGLWVGGLALAAFATSVRSLLWTAFVVGR
jgi:hypothetical protein